MPELPDVTIYIDKLNERVVGCAVERIRIHRPFVLRSFDPPIDDAEGREVRSISRMGKRIVLALTDQRFIVLHLMIAGRLRWVKRGAKAGRIGLAAFDFPDGTLLLTEAGTKKRASIHYVAGDSGLQVLDPGGLEVLECSPPEFAARLRGCRHTLKRALTNPHLFSGIGNAYSDEILHAARLSPFKHARQLDDDEAVRLYTATRDTLQRWIDALRRRFAHKFPGPGDITAFRDDFTVHGRFGRPCPVCGTKVQRVRFAENEMNYCPTCQTGGRVLADRSLSRLLREDWPRTVEEWEAGPTTPD
jgi:formamidopyrimidine-DNA glycosylase